MAATPVRERYKDNMWQLQECQQESIWVSVKLKCIPMLLKVSSPY